MKIWAAKNGSPNSDIDTNICGSNFLWRGIAPENINGTEKEMNPVLATVTSSMIVPGALWAGSLHSACLD